MMLARASNASRAIAVACALAASCESREHPEAAQGSGETMDSAPPPGDGPAIMAADWSRPLRGGSVWLALYGPGAAGAPWSPAETVERVADCGGDWLRVMLTWRGLSPWHHHGFVEDAWSAAFDSMMQAAQRRGVIVCLTLVVAQDVEAAAWAHSGWATANRGPCPERESLWETPLPLSLHARLIYLLSAHVARYKDNICVELCNEWRGDGGESWERTWAQLVREWAGCRVVASGETYGHADIYSPHRWSGVGALVVPSTDGADWNAVAIAAHMRAGGSLEIDGLGDVQGGRLGIDILCEALGGRP